MSRTLLAFCRDPGHNRRANPSQLWYDKTIYSEQATFMFISLPPLSRRFGRGRGVKHSMCYFPR